MSNNLRISSYCLRVGDTPALIQNPTGLFASLPSEERPSWFSSNSINAMNTVLGQNYQIFAPGSTDPVVLAKLPDEDLAPKNSVTDNKPEQNPSSQPIEDERSKQSEKTTDDYLFQFYLGSMTVVGLFILFRMIQKSK
jgi:hypothetical protein